MPSFHTTMVLTQHSGVWQLLGLSIPFPYHYGSHATRRLRKAIIGLWSFHTTMVLTQLTWRRKAPFFCSPFPYHYGSHATEWWPQESSTATRVSIPLWFSRNDKWCLNTHDHDLSVSIPLWFSRNYLKAEDNKLRKRHVSIPLWFSRNKNCSLSQKQAIERFHTTMVLTQPDEQAWENSSSYSFPYHYGSHATEPSGNSYRWARSVSIPLWFSRNSILGYHPTLIAAFPYHYGSHATCV